jgi:K(+)-stimulated pyrophosphate-energized sodium pump
VAPPFAATSGVTLAAEGGYQAFELGGGEKLALLFSALTALAALGVGFSLMKGVLAADRGTPAMIEIASAIQEGASAYLSRQFRTIAAIVIPLAVVVFLTSTDVLRPDGSEALSFVESGLFRTLAFIAGCLMSGLTGFIGMGLAVRGNVRTAAAAKTGSLPAALKVAFRTGGVAGMFTVGLGLLGATLIIAVFQNTSSASSSGSASVARSSPCSSGSGRHLHQGGRRGRRPRGQGRGGDPRGRRPQPGHHRRQRRRQRR